MDPGSRSQSEGSHRKLLAFTVIVNSALKLCMYAPSLSYLTLCDPLDCSPPGSSVGLFRQEYWSELPFPTPGDLPNPGVEPESPSL